MGKQEDILTRLVSGLSVRGVLLHPATLFLLATIGIIGGAIQLWNAHQDKIVDEGSYQLTVDKIQLPAPPEGSEYELKMMVLQSHGAAAPSLLDTQLIKKTVNAFQTVGFVEQVRSVEKTKQGLDIDLIYRHPVGMVELNHLTVSNWGRTQQAQLFPVDRQGVIMPSRLVAENPLMRFSIFNPARFTKLEAWTDWPDDRVKSAAAIASVLEGRWQALGLYRIVTFRKPDEPNDQSVPFELWPDSGTQVVWGNPPGEEYGQEVSAEKKRKALEEFVAKYGQLSQLPSQRIDIRSGVAIAVSASQVAELESMSKDR